MKEVDEESKEYLGNLPMTNSTEKHFLVHASRDDLFEYLKPDTELTKFNKFMDLKQVLIFLGHTHLSMDRNINEKRFVNPGSLGQPRDGDTRGAYAIMEDEEITFKRLNYDLESVVEKMNEKGYPSRAVRILRKGKVVE